MSFKAVYNYTNITCYFKMSKQSHLTMSVVIYYIAQIYIHNKFK